MKLGIGNTMHQNLFILSGNFVFKLNKKQKTIPVVNNLGNRC